MIARTHEQFSGLQPLRPLGDTMSAFLEVQARRYTRESSNPYVHVRVAAPLVPSGDTQLEIALLHADKGQPFTLWTVLLEPSYVVADMPPQLLVRRLPPASRAHLMLAYRITGDPLLGGAIDAFLHPLSAEEPERPDPKRFFYARSGFTWPPGFNKPGLPRADATPPPYQSVDQYF